jgi:hypothetical protein
MTPEVLTILAPFSGAFFLQCSRRGYGMRTLLILLTVLFCMPAHAQMCGLGDFGTGPYMKHGESRTFYSYGTALPPKTCADLAQVRTCNYGLLSGSNEYKVEKCFVPIQAQNECALGSMGGGPYLKHPEGRTLFKYEKVPAPDSCFKYSQYRACINGKLTGDPEYNILTCTVSTEVQAPTSQTVRPPTTTHSEPSWSRIFSDMRSLIVQSVPSYTRGNLHHHALRRPGIWHPEKPERFEAEVLILQSIAHSIALEEVFSLI